MTGLARAVDRDREGWLLRLALLWPAWQEAAIITSTFGATAPFDRLKSRFGFTADNVLEVPRKLLEGNG